MGEYSIHVNAIVTVKAESAEMACAKVASIIASSIDVEVIETELRKTYQTSSRDQCSIPAASTTSMISQSDK